MGERDRRDEGRQGRARGRIDGERGKVRDSGEGKRQEMEREVRLETVGRVRDRRDGDR